ncbi:MAG: energy transducer TonB [Pseudomonadota bacterium]
MIWIVISTLATALSLPIDQSDGLAGAQDALAQSTGKRKAKPINQDKWIAPEIIEARACRGERCFVGFVGYTLLVNREGRATDCAVTLTSGDRGLDVETCNLLLRGARFKPATNAKGEPVKGRYASSVLWTGRSVGPSPD